jgi:hypothetical protein
MGGPQFTPSTDPVEAPGFIEAPHPDRIFDRFTRPLEARVLLRVEEGDNVEVELGRVAAVQTQFVQAPASKTHEIWVCTSSTAGTVCA